LQRRASEDAGQDSAPLVVQETQRTRSRGATSVAMTLSALTQSKARATSAVAVSQETFQPKKFSSDFISRFEARPQTQTNEASAAAGSTSPSSGSSKQSNRVLKMSSSSSTASTSSGHEDSRSEGVVRPVSPAHSQDRGNHLVAADSATSCSRHEPSQLVDTDNRTEGLKPDPANQLPQATIQVADVSSEPPRINADVESGSEPAVAPLSVTEDKEDVHNPTCDRLNFNTEAGYHPVPSAQAPLSVPSSPGSSAKRGSRPSLGALPDLPQPPAPASSHVPESGSSALGPSPVVMMETSQDQPSEAEPQVEQTQTNEQDQGDDLGLVTEMASSTVVEADSSTNLPENNTYQGGVEAVVNVENQKEAAEPAADPESPKESGTTTVNVSDEGLTTATDPTSVDDHLRFPTVPQGQPARLSISLPLPLPPAPQPVQSAPPLSSDTEPENVLPPPPSPPAETVEDAVEVMPPPPNSPPPEDNSLVPAPVPSSDESKDSVSNTNVALVTPDTQCELAAAAEVVRPPSELSHRSQSSKHEDLITSAARARNYPEHLIGSQVIRSICLGSMPNKLSDPTLAFATVINDGMFDLAIAFNSKDSSGLTPQLNRLVQQCSVSPSPRAGTIVRVLAGAHRVRGMDNKVSQAAAYAFSRFLSSTTPATMSDSPYHTLACLESLLNSHPQGPFAIVEYAANASEVGTRIVPASFLQGLEIDSLGMALQNPVLDESRAVATTSTVAAAASDMLNNICFYFGRVSKVASKDDPLHALVYNMRTNRLGLLPVQSLTLFSTPRALAEHLHPVK